MATIIPTLPGPCKKDCPNRTETCHTDCEKYLAYRENLRAFREKQMQDKRLSDTMSESSKRQMWRDQRYSRRMRNRGKPER